MDARTMKHADELIERVARAIGKDEWRDWLPEAQAALDAAFEWQPIETMPKGDTHICLVRGVWNGEINGRAEFPTTNHVMMHGWMDTATVIGTDAYSATVEDITHWLPLPPAAEMEGE